ncbi:MAG: hypothetical protein KAT74_10050 [Candidatus Cloacimonetes bacterium]|nr:hypothetical protein [Candidatus Cloacimonadota bacterium]
MGKLVIIFILLIVLVTVTILFSARENVDRMPEMIIQNELTEQVKRIGTYALTYAVKQVTAYSVPLSGGSYTQKFDHFRVFEGAIDSLKYTINASQDSVIIRAYTYCRISGHEIYHESETLMSYAPKLVTPNGVTDAITAAGKVAVKGSAAVKGGIVENATFYFKEIFGYTKAEMEAGATHLYIDPENNIIPIDNITWVNFIDNDDFQITETSWEGGGILIVNGDMKITGGHFVGIIWVIGNLRVDGNPIIEGAVFVEGETDITTTVIGDPLIMYDSDAVSSTYLLLLASAFDLLTWYE